MHGESRSPARYHRRAEAGRMLWWRTHGGGTMPWSPAAAAGQKPQRDRPVLWSTMANPILPCNIWRQCNLRCPFHYSNAEIATGWEDSEYGMEQKEEGVGKIKKERASSLSGSEKAAPPGRITSMKRCCICWPVWEPKRVDMPSSQDASTRPGRDAGRWWSLRLGGRPLQDVFRFHPRSHRL